MLTPNDVERGLEALPDTLKGAYDEIYKRILDQNGSAPRLAVGAFRWMQCSYEPLCSGTLLDAIRSEIGDQGEFSPSRKDAITVNNLLKACQNLLIFDKQLNVFRFAHLSVDEYLETRLRKVDSHGEIAKVCLSLLCTSSSWDTYDKTLQTSEGRHFDRHLLLYSAVFWPWHFSLCRDTDGYQMLTYLCNKLMSEANHQRWFNYHRSTVEAHGTEDSFWRRVSALQQGANDPLSSVCVFGLSHMYTTIFKSKPRVEDIDQLLLLASQFGDLEIARLLIDSGADTSVTDESGWAPLHVAAWRGHETVARLLIDRGTDASVSNIHGSTPLHFAARNGNEAVARVLVGSGADVLAANTHGATPLHLAARNENEPVARLLTDWAADVSATDEDGSTPLHIAVWNGHEAVARLLMDRGADVSATNKHKMTPLHFAARNGHEAVARLLVDGGADVSAVDKHGSTPLHAALRNRHEVVARLLRNRGSTGAPLTAIRAPTTSA